MSGQPSIAGPEDSAGRIIAPVRVPLLTAPGSIAKLRAGVPFLRLGPFSWDLLAHWQRGLGSTALASIHSQHTCENVMQAAPLRVEQAPQQDRAEEDKRKPEQEGVESGDQWRHFLPKPGTPLKTHQALAEGRRVRAPDGQRVVTKAHNGEDGPEH